MDSRKVRLAGALTVLLGSVFPNAQTTPAQRDIRPVTDAMLQSPDPADWLMWRRTLDLWGHSPLTQIDRGNVGSQMASCGGLDHPRFKQMEAGGEGATGYGASRPEADGLGPEAHAVAIAAIGSA